MTNEATEQYMAEAMQHSLKEFRSPDAPDKIRLVIQHSGPSPEGPTTISKEGMQTLIDQFTAFIGGRILARMDEGESVEQVIVLIDLNTSRHSPGEHHEVRIDDALDLGDDV